ncbi:MAG: lipoyl(octanoyl) transferase LipB [Actinomycetota bacterium]|nr:lipoyl(octanoyl) transferase LipB [Actinomycetota bacterium]
MNRGWIVAPGRVPYAAAYAAMHELAERRLAGEVPDLLILLEHPPVYTAGRRTDPSHLLLTEERMRELGAEVHHVDRGGSVTFHGPGQLVGYPILDLGPRPDVIRYLRNIEEVVIGAAGAFGVGCGREDVNTGVWSRGKKVCAIGVKTTRSVTLHGFALNCTTDLSWFDAIVPCGLADHGVTSLSNEAGRTVTVSDALPVVARRFERVFDVALHPAPPDVEALVAGGPAVATRAS